MYRLTEKRFRDAGDILKRYREQLFRAKRFDVGSFERELRDLWDVGYQELKSIVRDMANHGRCEELAVYYMENSNSSVGVVMEFQAPLAKIYGITHYHAKDREQRQREYWARALGAKTA